MDSVPRTAERALYAARIKTLSSNKNALGDLLGGLPDDLRKRVQSVWVNPDGSMSIDFVTEEISPRPSDAAK